MAIAEKYPTFDAWWTSNPFLRDSGECSRQRNRRHRTSGARQRPPAVASNVRDAHWGIMEKIEEKYPTFDVWWASSPFSHEPPAAIMSRDTIRAMCADAWSTSARVTRALDKKQAEGG